MKIVRLNSLSFPLAFLISFIFAACGSDDNGADPKDTEAPVINIETPAEGASFVRGINEIEISGELSDNQALGSCIISLTTDLKSVSSTKSSSVDGGESSGDDVVTSIDDPEPFIPDPVEYALSGKSHTFSGESLFGVIPYDALTGQYTLTIEVIDAAGNSASKDISVQISE